MERHFELSINLSTGSGHGTEGAELSIPAPYVTFQPFQIRLRTRRSIRYSIDQLRDTENGLNVPQLQPDLRIEPHVFERSREVLNLVNQLDYGRSGDDTAHYR